MLLPRSRLTVAEPRRKVQSTPGFRLTIRGAPKLVSSEVKILPSPRNVSFPLPLPNRQTVLLPQQRSRTSHMRTIQTTLLGITLLATGCVNAPQSQPQPQPTAATGGELWRSDFRAFTETLQAVAKGGKVPSLRALGKEFEANWEGITLLSDGGGGFIDRSPEEGSIQDKVNKYFAGARVRWSVILAEDVFLGGIGHTVGIVPDQFPPNTVRTGKLKQAEVFSVDVRKDTLPRGSDLRMGETVVIEGTIDDAAESTNRRGRGIQAAYHYRELGKDRTVYIVCLEDVKLFRQETNREPDGAANGSQPIRSETNRTSSAAGSDR